MKRGIMIFINVLAFALLFLFFRWFYMSFLYFPAMSFRRSIPSVDFWVPLFHIIVLTFFSYLIIQSLHTKTIPTITVYAFYCIYAYIMINALFLNSIGTRGFTFDPLLLISDLFTLIVFLNIVVFIPIGLLFDLTKRSLCIFIIGILMVEITQFVLHLGFFDVGDVIANTVGFIVGTMIRTSKTGKMFRSYIRPVPEWLSFGKIKLMIEDSKKILQSKE